MDLFKQGWIVRTINSVCPGLQKGQEAGGIRRKVSVIEIHKDTNRFSEQILKKSPNVSFPQRFRVPIPGWVKQFANPVRHVTANRKGIIRKRGERWSAAGRDNGTDFVFAVYITRRGEQAPSKPSG